MKEVVFFSNNKHKIDEVLMLFKNSTIKILSLNDFNKAKSPEETGGNFKDNAKIKSFYGFRNFKKICFADDSGICIQAMNGGPGVNSKNFLAQDTKNEILKNIINLVKKQNNYNAYFQTTICLSLDDNNHIFFNGKIDGKISKEIRGENGFGYDPIFIPRGKNLTFAEMHITEKNALSHRSIATNKLKKFILNLI